LPSEGETNVDCTNDINVLGAAFTSKDPKSTKRQFLDVCVCKSFKYNGVEFEPTCQFHQHFTRTFLYESIFSKLFSKTVCVCVFWQKNIGEKSACKLLVNLSSALNFTNIL
jgi:hypothetical protein